MTLSLFLFVLLSLTANVVLVWYIKILSKRFVETLKGIDSFQEYLDTYLKSVEEVYTLTDFYGDQTIKSLIENTKTVAEACYKFKSSVLGEEQTEDEIKKQ